MGGMSSDGRFYDLPDRDQTQIFAPSLRQAIADDPEVLAFDAAVDQLDFAAWAAEYSRVGHPAFAPQLLFKVLVYAYLLGLRSSRQIDRACRRDDAFKFLAHGLTPDFRTLCRFRRRHLDHFGELFQQTVRHCQAAGLVSLGNVAIDGTKLRANRSKAGLAAAQAEFRPALAEAELADAELPEESPEAGEEARFMKTEAGLVPAYNAQLAVDADHQIIVAPQVRTEPADQGLLAPLAQQVQDNCGQPPQAICADGGYVTKADLERMDASGTPVYLPPRERATAGLEWVESAQAFRCPAGQGLRAGRVREGRQIYRTRTCAGCPHASACGVKAGEKHVYVPLPDTPRGRLERRMASEAGQALYAARKQIIEPVFGRFKHNWGLRRLLLRGKSGAQAEWSLTCIGHNLRKLIQAGGPPGASSAPGPGRATTNPQPQLSSGVIRWLRGFARSGRPRRFATA